MNVKVFIPSYKRLYSLKYVVQSLFKAETPIFVENYKLYMINNWPPNRNKIEALMAEMSEKYNIENKWDIEIISRDKTIEPAYSWYNAILENCNDNDIVFLSGDDDLFTQDSITTRVKILNENPNCPILISSFYGGLIFNQDNNNIYFNLKKFEQEKFLKSNKIQNLKIDDVATKNSIFLGNNCYRFGEVFKNSLKKAFDWCDQLHWLDLNTRTLMLPYYIPLAVAINEGEILFVNNLFIIRGVDYNESVKSAWGVSGWNCGFLELTSICVLNNNELKKYSEFQEIKKTSLQIISEWYLTFFVDSRISNESLIMSIKYSSIKPTYNTFNGVSMLVKQFLRYIKIYKYFKLINFKTPLIEPNLLIKSI